MATVTDINMGNVSNNSVFREDCPKTVGHCQKEVSSVSIHDEVVDQITGELMAMSFQDGEKLQLLSRGGPDGGRPTPYNHSMYSQQYGTPPQVKGQLELLSGKRNRQDETNPYKYSRNNLTERSSYFPEYKFGHTFSITKAETLLNPPEDSDKLTISQPRKQDESMQRAYFPLPALPPAIVRTMTEQDQENFLFGNPDIQFEPEHLEKLVSCLTQETIAEFYRCGQTASEECEDSGNLPKFIIQNDQEQVTGLEGTGQAIQTPARDSLHSEQNLWENTGYTPQRSGSLDSLSLSKGPNASLASLAPPFTHCADNKAEALFDTHYLSTKSISDTQLAIVGICGGRGEAHSLYSVAPRESRNQGIASNPRCPASHPSINRISFEGFNSHQEKRRDDGGVKIIKPENNNKMCDYRQTKVNTFTNEQIRHSKSSLKPDSGWSTCRAEVVGDQRMTEVQERDKSSTMADAAVKKGCMDLAEARASHNLPNCVNKSPAELPPQTPRLTETVPNKTEFKGDVHMCRHTGQRMAKDTHAFGRSNIPSRTACTTVRHISNKQSSKILNRGDGIQSVSAEIRPAEPFQNWYWETSLTGDQPEAAILANPGVQPHYTFQANQGYSSQTSQRNLSQGMKGTNILKLRPILPKPIPVTAFLASTGSPSFSANRCNKPSQIPDQSNCQRIKFCSFRADLMRKQRMELQPAKMNKARRFVAALTTKDLCCQDQDGDTYLHIAICKTDLFLVKALLERLKRENLITEMINKCNNLQQTPLYVAVADNRPLMVRELLNYGADPNHQAECHLNNGMRKEVKAAIHCAAQGGHLYTETLAELLQAKDIALNLANSEGLMALHCAMKEHGKVRQSQSVNSIPMVELLIKAGADPNAQDKKSGKTPLMYAIETKDYDLVYSMIKLIDKDKLTTMLKTQTFDGNNCGKLCSGLNMPSDHDGWKKINSLIFSSGSS